MLRTIYLETANAAQEKDGKLQPVTEFLLFGYGKSETTQGTVTLSNEASAKRVMAAYEAQTKGRNGLIDIDYRHKSRDKSSSIEDAISAGKCKLELREDGIWVKDIAPTKRAKAYLEEGEYWSYSPVIDVNSKGELVSIAQLSLTNIPSMYGAGVLAAEDGTDVDTLLLSVSPFQKYPLFEDASWDGRAADQRVREFLSSDGSGDMDKVDMTRYRKAFVFFDGEAPESISRYKGQILDVQDVGNGPELVISKRAVQTLGAIMQGSRGGINLSESDREKGKVILAKYYKLFDAVAPWDREKPAEMAMEERKMTTPRVERLMLEAKWSNEQRDMLKKVVGYRFGEHAYIDDWSADKVRVCVYGEEMGPSKMYEIPYTMEGDKAVLGEPVEVKVSYVPVAQAVAEMAMQDRLNVAHTKLLEVTGKESTSEAVVLLEAISKQAARVPDLETKIKTLEDERFTTARAELTAKAKREGRWTLALEERGDAVVSLAKRCNEDAVKTLEAHWNSAPVLVAPGGATPPKHEGQTLTLSDDEEATAAAVAKMLHISLEDSRTNILTAKKERAQRNS